MHNYATIKRQISYLSFALSSGGSASDYDYHQLAMEGWKVRKDQLHKQQKSITEVNEESEKVNLLSLSKQKRN